MDLRSGGAGNAGNNNATGASIQTEAKHGVAAPCNGSEHGNASTRTITETPPDIVIETSASGTRLPKGSKRQLTTLQQRNPDLSPSVAKMKKLSLEPVKAVDAMDVVGEGEHCESSWSDLKYDTLFVETDSQFDQVLKLCHEHHPGVRVHLIKDINDLKDGGLLHDIIVNEAPIDQADSFGEVSTEQIVDGAIYRDDPVILLLDCRNIKVSQLAEFNELLDKKPAYERRPLGPGCKRIILVDQTMLADKRSRKANKARGDFWRRVSRVSNSWQIPGNDKSSTPVPKLETMVKTLAAQDKPSSQCHVTLDFQLESEWRTVLAGSYGLNKDNQAEYRTSQIEALLREDSGGTVVLQGAPWENPAFRVFLYMMLVQGGYWANGRFIDTSHLTFVKQPSNPESINTLLECIEFAQKPSDNGYSINASNLDICLSDAHISDNAIHSHNLLEEIISRHKGLHISSPLSESQWVRLLKKIRDCQSGHQQTRVPITVCQPNSQPGQICCNVKPVNPALEFRQTSILTEDDASYLAAIQGDKQDATYHLSLTKDLELPDIATECAIQSLYMRQLTVADTGFVKALEAGTPVFLYNLHKCQVLQQQLESLLATPCSLLINGAYREFPDARVIIVKPDGCRFSSTLWNTCKVTSVGIPETPEQVIEAGLDDGEKVYFHRLPQLFKSLSTVPASPRKEWPYPLPEINSVILNKIVRQARAEQFWSCASNPRAEHWREAVRQAVLEEYRGNREVYSFLCQLCDRTFPGGGVSDNKGTIDKAAFSQFLEQHNYRINRGIVSKNFWTLSRALPPGMIPAENFREPGWNYHNILCSAIVRCCPEERQAQMARDLNLQGNWLSPVEHLQEASPMAGRDTSTSPDISERQADNLTRLLEEHKLVVLKGDPGTGKTRMANGVSKTLNPSVAPVTVTAGPQTTQESLLRQHISEDVVSVDHLSNPNLGLSEDETQLLVSLASPADECIHLSPQVKRELSAALSPQRYQLILNRLSGVSDISSSVKDGPILQWAKRRDESGRPIILIIDEANLTQPDVWDIFHGLFDSSPSISAGGESIPLSPQHRVIMTGNPETAPGRRLSSFIRNHAVTCYYQPLPDDFMADNIVAPRLNEILAPCVASGVLGQEHCVQVLKQIMSLWSCFRPLLPEHEFTPRDLHEICDRLALYLGEEMLRGECTPASVSSLVWTCFTETLGQEFPPNYRQLDSLAAWYAHRAGSAINGQYTAIDAEFDQFYQSLQSSEAFSYRGASVENLARQIWATTRKISSEKQSQSVHQGKHATLIEGPPGRGKDALLTRIIQHSLKDDRPPVHLNAGSGDWDEIKFAIKEAAGQGRIIMVSELNLMPSQYLEEELNNVLTGDAKPGFHLFATINPAEFSGRENFSPALNSRFVRNIIGDYSDNELYSIAACYPRAMAEISSTVTRWHCQLRDRILEADRDGVVPCTSDLKNLLDHIRSHQVQDMEKVKELFARQYHVFLKMARIRIDRLTREGKSKADSKPISVNTEISPEERQKVLTFLYSSFEELTPVSLVEGASNSFNPSAGTLQIKKPVVLPEVTMAVIDGLWKSTGVPIHFPMENDALASALQTFWKKRHATEQIASRPALAKVLGCSHDIADGISHHYPLTENEQLTLKRVENRKYVAAVKHLVFSRNGFPDLVSFRQFLHILSCPEHELPAAEGDTGAMNTDRPDDEPQPMDTDRDGGPAEGTDQVPLSCQDSSTGELTDVDAGEGKVITQDQVFKDYSCRDHRDGVIMPTVSASGKILLELNKLAQMGVNSVTVAPPANNIILSSSQAQARQVLPLGDGKWHILCGLRKFPSATIAYLGTDSGIPLEVVYDRATGLNLVRVPGPFCDRLGNDETVAVDMVLDLKVEEPELDDVPISFHNWCRCPDIVKEVVENHSSKDVAILRALLEMAPTVHAEIELIKSFCLASCEETPLTGEGRERLSNLLANRSYYVNHRNVVFWMMARWRGIPSRITSFYKMEVSANGGLSWISLDLMTKVDNPDELETKPVSVPEMAQEEKPGLDTSSWGYREEESDQNKLRHYLDTIHPGTKYYLDLTTLMRSTGCRQITMSGPVSVERMKKWLTTFYRQASDLERQHFLTMFIQGLKIFSSVNSEEKEDVYRELTKFIVADNRWLARENFTSAIHSLMLQTVSQYVKALSNQLYQASFTHKLEPGKDILLPDPTLPRAEPPNDIFSRFKLSSAEASEVMSLMEGIRSPRLERILYGDLPGESYKRVPPGALNVSRLIQQLPAFRCNITVPVLRPALVVAPLDESGCSIGVDLEQKLRKPSDRMRLYQTSYESRCDLFTKFYREYVREAFLKYLWTTGGGEQGRLKVMFPSERKKPHEWEKKTKPYVPERTGWLVPRSFEEFKGLVSVSPDDFVPIDDNDLRESWASLGFNESNLCLLDSTTLKDCMKDWVDQADWGSIMPGLEANGKWQKSVEQTLKLLKRFVEDEECPDDYGIINDMI